MSEQQVNNTGCFGVRILGSKKVPFPEISEFFFGVDFFLFLIFYLFINYYFF